MGIMLARSDALRASNQRPDWFFSSWFFWWLLGDITVSSGGQYEIMYLCQLDSNRWWIVEAPPEALHRFTTRSRVDS
jgi:hypothetical protein